MNLSAAIRRRALLGAALILAGPVGSAAAEDVVIDLVGDDATGFFAMVGLNQEAIEPNTPGGKTFDYPYYDSPENPGFFWVMQVEPYEFGLTYPDPLHPEGPIPTLVSVTGLTEGLTEDADFADFDIGTITFDPAPLTGTGTETIPAASLTVELDPSDFEGNTARFPPGEFPSGFTSTTLSVTGTGLTFTNGELTSIDLVVDFEFQAFLGDPAAGTVTFSGLGFTFDMDTFIDIPFFADNVRTFLNRAGTIDLLPECSDGIDNDGDGLVDFAGGDPGCASAGDVSERDQTGTIECDDGIDNDGDGRVDFDPVTAASPGDEVTLPAGVGDPTCITADTADESRQCSNGLDDDGAPGIDYDGGLSLDLDENGFIDAAFNSAEPAVGAADPQCVGKPARGKESSGGCGLGPELALLLPLISRLRGRRRA